MNQVRGIAYVLRLVLTLALIVTVWNQAVWSVATALGLSAIAIEGLSLAVQGFGTRLRLVEDWIEMENRLRVLRTEHVPLRRRES